MDFANTLVYFCSEGLLSVAKMCLCLRICRADWLCTARQEAPNLLRTLLMRISVPGSLHIASHSPHLNTHLDAPNY